MIQLSLEMTRLTGECAAAYRALPADAWIEPRGAGKWSRLQELGHLIDSAANNHQRFARALVFDSYSGPGYPQQQMVSVQRFATAPPEMILSLWESYNLFLARLISLIPAEKLGTICNVADYAPITLEFMVTDYVAHMQHHLRSIAFGTDVQVRWIEIQEWLNIYGN